MEVTTDFEHVIRNLKQQLLIERIVIGVLALSFFCYWGYGRVVNPKSVIVVNGRTVACVPSASEANDVLRHIKSKSGCNPDEIRFAEDVRIARAPRDMNPVSRHIAIRLLERRISVMAPRWAILVNGKPAVGLPDKKSAGETLDLAKLKFGQMVQNLAEEPQFKEDVKVDLVPVEPDIYCKTPEQAVKMLFDKSRSVPAAGGRFYVVEKGDLAGEIAARNGMKLEDLEKVNPGRDLDRLQIGDKICLASGGRARAARPTLTVVVRDQSDRTESISAPVEQVANSQLPDGERRDISSGRPGLRQVRVATIYENGRRVGNEVLEEQIIRQPRSRRVAVGIKHSH